MDEERQFDFLEGRWDAVCRVPSQDGWAEVGGFVVADGKREVT